MIVIITMTLHPTNIITKNELPPIMKPMKANNFLASFTEYLFDRKSDNFAHKIQAAPVIRFGIEAKNPEFCKSRLSL